MENQEKVKVDDLEDSSADEAEDRESCNIPISIAILRDLRRALNERIRVSTSTISHNDSTEFVGIEGDPDEETLQCLEESISDIISYSDDHRSLLSSQSRISEQKKESSIAISSDTGNHGNSSNSSYFSIPSCTSSHADSVTDDALRNAEEAINDLQTNGPAGLVHLSSLSAAIGKPIRIWYSDTGNSKKVGRTNTGEVVDAEYHEPGPGEESGHWTLPGNREPRDTEGQLNDCLFSVVAAQTDRLAPELRAETITRMRKNVRSLARRVEKIAKLEKCDRISLLVGGAKYSGRRPQDARDVIDKSQQGRCHPQGLQGHPRGHASHPGASGATESAENYSRGSWKTAFLSREDQDAVGHLALSTPKAREAMEQLNRGTTSVAIDVSPGELEPGALPGGVEFRDGQRSSGERPFRTLLLVLRHHQGQENNRDADVFVHTFYPKLQ